jgi:methylated-DNA-[protein]-cysteine S-methyltransferase
MSTSSAVWSVIDSPVGELLLTGDGSHHLTGILFDGHRDGRDARPDAARLGREAPDDPVLTRAADQLAEYFALERTMFDLPLDPAGTGFQRRVWTALLDVPYGRTASYGQIAERIGLLPSASRAVGHANGTNPISIVVPCHRIIGADGSLTGYGGGLDRKRFLLDLEQGVLF